MLLSMTGFGLTSGSFKNKKISVELKTLNHKGLDFSSKINQQYKELEAPIRTLIIEKLERGKIDLLISVENAGKNISHSINMELALLYANELRTLNKKLGFSENDYDYLPIIMQKDDVFINEQELLEQEERKFIFDLVSGAIDKVIEFRRQEGFSIETEFIERIQYIAKLLEQIEPFEKSRVDTIREKMLTKFDDLKTIHYDANRLEQELIYYIERLDISEEKTRLSNHLNYFLETLSFNNSGKKLGFIVQEIGREMHTLSSKSNHYEIQKLVVDMKDNLEKIREQIANIL